MKWLEEKLSHSFVEHRIVQALLGDCVDSKNEIGTLFSIFGVWLRLFLWDFANLILKKLHQFYFSSRSVKFVSLFFEFLVAKHHKQMTHTSNDEILPSTNWSNVNVDDLQIEFYHLDTFESLEKGIQLRQRRGPCSCIALNCGCCAGMAMQQFNFRRKRMLLSI